MTVAASPVEWFREAFNEEYRLVYAARTNEQAQDETACIVRALGIQTGDRVLDLCCGHGRHLQAFRQRGLSAVGLDLSLPLLREFRDSFASGAADIVQGDMRRLPFDGCFDVVVNFFTSFGYFEFEIDHQRVVHELAGTLKPKGRFSLDLMNAARAVRTLVPTTERQVAGFTVIENRRYDKLRRRIEKDVTLRDTRGETAKSYTESVRVFSTDEITALLANAGLRVDRLLGDFTDAPYHDDSARMIILGSKPPSSRVALS